ncbi:MAG TPA: amidophosphoribosyltransferase [bacterium]|nr:amidophosphoribosyltransferase [bacterium]HQB09446.1 amidophosphoribosyltransferase [bacterium]HQM84491.1 amidophosphoribosyltransferase [bacterium]
MCGIAGVFNVENGEILVAEILFAIQHRGQESCGIASKNEFGNISGYRGMGLVKNVLTESILAKYQGKIAIGHVRYPTAGRSDETNSQPHVIELPEGPHLAICSNGDIINYYELRTWLEKEYEFTFKSDNDGELIGRLIAFNLIHRKMTIENAIVETQSQLKGAFSSIVIYRDQMFAFRDPHAYRPYILGHLQGVSETGEYSSNGVVLASESCAFGIVGAKMIRELEPGEIIKLEKDKPMKTIAVNSKNKQHCVFELIYFSRPDTIVYEEKVYAVRKKIGARLAEYDKELGFGEDTVVMAVPDSSNFVALGYAHGSGLQFDMGLLRNHYVGRTFTKPDQKQRDEGVRHKFNPLPEFFKGKKVVLVDDSIVRGTTLRKIVRMIRSAGAKEVHVRIGSPRVIGSCYYGIDTPTRRELIAAIKNNDEICQFLEAESLRYIEVTDFERILKNSDNFCFACFNLKYEYKPEDFHQKVNSPDKRC